MRACRLFSLSLISLCALTAAAPAQAPTVVRTINSANPEPPMYNWHPHNRLGIERGAFAGVRAFNRVLIREEGGEVLEVPFFHFTARDLGEIINRMAKFPAQTRVVDYTPGEAPIVDLRPSELQPGPLEKWPNHGLLGGGYYSMNVPPVVEDIQGRRAVHFDCNQWYFDTRYNAMVLDAMPAKALREGMPFTLSAWVLHPKEPDVDDCEMIMSWHTRGGNNGTGLDWKRSWCWGDFSVLGMGGDLTMEPKHTPKPMPEWTHVAYVYTGGGLKGELRVYENGKFTGAARTDFLPKLLAPSQITSTSVMLRGYLDTAGNDAVYVRGYIGDYDAHHYRWPRTNIGCWDKWSEIGLRPKGEFEVPFKDLLPGKRYYYRVFASQTPDFPHPYLTCRWANGVGSFITATEDGKPGQVIPSDEDRYLFLGVQWGSRWYLSYPGPAGFFRGYMGDTKLYDRALTEEEIRRDANALTLYDGVPADAGVSVLDKGGFAWKSGIPSAARYRLYMDTERGKVTEGTATSQETTTASIQNVKLKPGRTHYWRVDALDAAGKVLAKGPVWQFHATYGEPFLPMPGNGSSVSVVGDFRWNQTISNLKEQRFYLGQDAAAVLSATTPMARPEAAAREHSVPPGTLHPGATWYWRVETVLEDGAVVPGPLWSFKTPGYFEPEFDGPASEPFPEGITPSRAARLMEGMGNPTISTPRADEAGLRDIAHATKRYLRKSLQLRNQLASRPCATSMASPEGSPCVDGFACGSYGGLPDWNMTMHEMGHQTLMFGMGTLDPSFYRRLSEVFNAHADNNAWLADYAAVNIHENIACSGHQFISGPGREALLRDDAPTFYLLSEYFPGDLAIDLHPANGLTLDAENGVVRWDNRGGVEDRVPGGQGYAAADSTTGTFQATGRPKLKTVQGAAAVVFAGSESLTWDKKLQYGFEGNRAWSVEFWARREAEGNGDGLLLGWGPEEKGVRLYWGGSSKVWNVSGNAADWPAKPGAGKWNHIAFVFEGGGVSNTEGAMRLFLNGKEILTKSYKLDLVAKLPVEIGGLARDGRVESGFNGALAHVRVHNYAISHDQVSEHFTQERRGYERTAPPHVAGSLYVDLDATQIQETGAEDHRPLYPAALRKPWVRSWANKGILQGRVHNDVSALWHYSGSTPLYREVSGLQALRFMGKDRMVGVIELRGSAAKQAPGTLEAVVFSEATSPDEVVLEWGGLVLDARYLKPGWQHVAVTPEGSGSAVFVDGARAGEIPGVLKPGVPDHLHLGAHFDPLRESWYRYFNGAIALVRVHEQALTPEQIAANAKQSPVFAAHTPSPADGARVAAARKPALSWTPRRNSAAAEPVLFGEDPAKLALAGSFKPREFKPEFAGGKRYFWRAGGGPVWSFETTQGELVSLSAKDLPQGPLAAWENRGTAKGRFTPADRGNLLGVDVENFAGVKALRMTKGRKMTFRPEGRKPEVLLKGPFTISFRATSDNFTEEVPLLAWGAASAPARLWFGTGAEDRRLITVGRSSPRSVDEAYPASQLRMIYPEGQNARMAFVWKTITVTYADGRAELWYNNRRIDSRNTDLAVGELGDLVFGWDFQDCNGNILLNELRIYDAVVGQTGIEQLAKGKPVDGMSPIVWITAEDLEPGTRAAVLKNHGALQGAFATEPEVDRKPEVRAVNGKSAVVFNGAAMLTSDFLLPEALSDARPFTVEMWALQDEASKDTRLLAFSQEVSERHTSFAMGSAADARALVRPLSGAEWKISPDEKPGQWVHLAWVYDGGQHAKVRLYRNGSLNIEHDFRTVDTIGGYPISIGGMMSGATGETALFRGAISEARIFDYPRTAEEIAASAKAN